MSAQHRRPRLIARRLIQQVSVGVVALAAAIGLLVAITMQDDKGASPTAASASGLVLGEEESVEPSVAASIAASNDPSLASSPSAAASASTDALPAQYATVKVGVFNTTALMGLAAKVAQRLTADGWDVTTIDGFSSTITRSTVYYDDATESAALWMAAHDPLVKVALPRPASINGNGGLVVAVASDAL